MPRPSVTAARSAAGTSASGRSAARSAARPSAEASARPGRAQSNGRFPAGHDPSSGGSVASTLTVRSDSTRTWHDRRMSGPNDASRASRSRSSSFSGPASPEMIWTRQVVHFATPPHLWRMSIPPSSIARTSFVPASPLRTSAPAFDRHGWHAGQPWFGSGNRSGRSELSGPPSAAGGNSAEDRSAAHGRNGQPGRCHLTVASDRVDLDAPLITLGAGVVPDQVHDLLGIVDPGEQETSACPCRSATTTTVPRPRIRSAGGSAGG